ncbi:MAG: hypothetical protein OWQ56_06420 [Acidithiobacillus caldus]|nr:hypothetical protein [Acidithiobacillus caldus]
MNVTPRETARQKIMTTAEVLLKEESPRFCSAAELFEADPDAFLASEYIRFITECDIRDQGI